MTHHIIDRRTHEVVAQLKTGKTDALHGQSLVLLAVRRLVHDGHIDWTRVHDLIRQADLNDVAREAAEAEAAALAKTIPHRARSPPPPPRPRPAPEPVAVAPPTPRKVPAQLLFDASCSPITQSCGAAYVLQQGKKRLAMRTLSLPFIGVAQAETEACIAGLLHALELGITHVDVLGDCEATIRAVNGIGNRKARNLRHIHELRPRFAYLAGHHVGRGANGLADALASEATHVRGEWSP